jgi:SAM-dependent methyltransferase
VNYLEGAEMYYELFGEKDDVGFYLGLAEEHGGRALELGVGTARLAIQLARSGIETWGVDNSPHMLSAARKNLSRESAEVRGRVHLKLADVRGLDLGERFGLIYFPSFSFDHLLTREDQCLALEAIHHHMAHGGVYAFDLAHVPEVRRDSGWFVQRKPLDERRMVVRTGHHYTDPKSMRMSIDLWYELFEDGRMVERFFEGGDVYIHSKEGIVGLLSGTGFRIRELYGGHDRRPFEEGSEMMVIVAEPA